MEISKNNLSDARVELSVTAAAAEVEKYLVAAAERLSTQVKLAGFRPGKAPYDVVKSQVGAAALWEEAARLFIDKNLEKLLKENFPQPVIGQPRLTITKLAPGNDLNYQLEVELLPEVKLGAYQDLAIATPAATVSEEEINKALEQLRETRLKEALVDRPLQATDKALVDIKMFLDQVPLEGGQSLDTAVVLGKDYIIPGFDEKLLGARRGEEREFFLIYPREHWQKNLAGKKVEFKVKVKEIYERILPAADYELAKSFNFKDIDELRANITKGLQAEKERRAEDQARGIMLDKILAASQLSELPKSLVEAELEMMLAEIEHGVTHDGGNFVEYLSSLQKTAESLRQQLRPDAVKRVQLALLLGQIAQTEKIIVEPAAVEHELEHLREHYQGDEQALTALNSAAYRWRLTEELIKRQTLAKLSEWNIKPYAGT